MRKPLTPPERQTWTMTDGYELCGRVWNSRPARPEAYLYFHGIQSHGGWFERSGSLLARDGAMVIMPDRRGSGLNQAARGDTPSLDRWIADVEELAAWAEGVAGSSRLRLVGVSWGGKLAAMHAIRHPNQVDRLLLITPGLFPAVDVGIRTRIGIASSLLAGGDANFEIPLSDSTLFTDNPDGRAFIESDALKLTHATARLLWHSTRFDRALRRTRDAALRVPTWLFLAERDRIIRTEAVANWCQRVCGDGLQILRFDDVHTLEFGKSPERFERELRNWST